jgi:hypothetical protein
MLFVRGVRLIIGLQSNSFNFFILSFIWVVISRFISEIGVRTMR